MTSAARSAPASRQEDELIRLLHACTVLVVCDGERGTGFFVAPDLVMTCAHVVRRRRRIAIKWLQEEFQGTLTHIFPDPYPQADNVFPDVALISVTVPGHPCVLLDDKCELRDPLYVFGYSDFAAGGESLTGECEGKRDYAAGDPAASLIKFKETQVRPGISGSALLNQRTGRVCGMVKRTRDAERDAGGLAVRMSAVFELHREVADQNRSFHLTNRQWTELADGDLAEYREWLRQEFGQGKTLSGAPLGDVYIGQRVREVQARAEPDRTAASASRGGISTRSVESLLASQSRQVLIVMGGPGQGKLTLLRHQAREWIDHRSDVVPLVIKLRSYAAERPQGRFPEFLADNSYVPQELARSLLRDGKAMLLLDSLDEVSPDKRDAVIRDIRDAVNRYPNSHIVVTTRPMTGYARAHAELLDSAGFRRFALEDFDPAEASQFIEKWRAGRSPQERQSADSLLRAMQESASFRRMAGKPLLLALALKLGRVATRAQLYEYFAEWLLKDRDFERGIVSPKPEAQGNLKIAILEAIALYVCDDEDGLTDTAISGAGLEEVLKGVLIGREEDCTAESIDKHRDSLTHHDSMLEKTRSGYEFVHRTMLEYFCARAYCERFRKDPGFSGKLAPLFRSHWSDYRWDEILTLICGISQKKAVPLVRELLSLSGLEGGWRATLLAALCLSEIEPCGEATEVQPLVRAELEKLLTFDFPFVYRPDDNEANQLVVIRTSAADRLSRWPDEATRQRLVREVSMNLSEGACAGMVPIVAAAWPDDVTFAWLHEVVIGHGSGPVRIAATRELARRWRVSESMDRLIAQLETCEDPQIRFAACGELSRSSPDERARVALVNCARRDSDDYVREEALKVLAWCWRNSDTSEMLLELARTGQPWYVRKAALVILAAAAPSDGRTRDLCTDRAVNDERLVLRHVALLSLRNWPDEDTRRLVFQRAEEDKDRLIRESAAYLAAEMWQGEETLAFLRNRMEAETDPSARPGIFRAILRARTGPDLEKELESRALESPHPEIRITAISELAQRTKADIVEPLARTMAEHDSSPDVRGYCIYLVARISQAADIASWLRERAERDENPGVQETAVRDFGRRCRSEQDRQWLVRMAEEKAAQPPANIAILALARRWRDERTRAWLMERIAKASQEEAATRGPLPQLAMAYRFGIQPGDVELGELVHGWRDTETCDFLLARLPEGEGPATGFSTVNALGWMLPPDRALTLLKDLVREERPPAVQAAAAEVLGYRFHDDSVRLFLSALATEHTDQSVRAAAITGMASQWQDIRTRELLLKSAAEDPSSLVRSSAISGLGRNWNDEKLRAFFETRIVAEAELAKQPGPPGPSVFVDVTLRQNIIQQLGRW